MITTRDAKPKEQHAGYAHHLSKCTPSFLKTKEDSKTSIKQRSRPFSAAIN
jgi:hypothetical protein